MKKFFAPTIEIVKLNDKDIIATSGSLDLGGSITDPSLIQSRGDFDDDWDF